MRVDLKYVQRDIFLIIIKPAEKCVADRFQLQNEEWWYDNRSKSK